MQVEHGRAFTTQYHFKDKIFDDTLKPAPNEAIMRRTASKEAFVRPDGKVLVREKRFHRKLDMGMASANSTFEGGASAEYCIQMPQLARATNTNESKSEQTRGLRHVSSAYPTTTDLQGFSKVINNSMQSGITENSNLRKTHTAWKPGSAVSKMFDDTPFVSIIPPERFEQTPFRQLETRLLNKARTEFVKHIGNLNRPFGILKNKHYLEKPPRYFYDHSKQEYDFFKNMQENLPAVESVNPAVAPQGHLSKKAAVGQAENLRSRENSAAGRFRLKKAASTKAV